MYKYFILLFIVVAACQETYKADDEVKAELILIDTLNNRLQTVKSWLDYMPIEEIRERSDIIKNNYEFCEGKYKEKKMIVDEETTRLMNEYNNYGELYAKALDSFKPLVMEMEELFVQLKTLKESAHSKDYQKETFLNYFKNEKKDVEAMYKFAENVLKPIKDTDLAFERAQKKVEELAESLKD